MNLSQSELPLTSFWDYIPGSSRTSNNKKENGQSSRPKGKRKRDGLHAKAKPENLEKGKRTEAITLKEMTVLHRTTPKKPSRIYGVARVSTSKGQQLALDNISQQRTSHSVEVLDLTSSPDSPTRNRKQRRVEKVMPDDHPLSSDTHAHVDQTFPTPPPTLFSKSMAWPIAVGGQPSAPGPLPTPGTSVPRLRKRAKPSQLSKIPIPSKSTSPLASRQGAIMPSSPLFPGLIDIQPMADDSNAEIWQALRDVASKSHNDDLLGRGDEDDNPFTTSSAAPSSKSLSNNFLHRSISVAQAETTSPVIAIHSLPNQLRTMQPLRLTDPIVSPSKCLIESSQSQILLPFADSPRRKQHSHPNIVSSSQSQILLPFADSPRRMKELFAPAMQNNELVNLGESVRVVPSSQSQTEKELRFSSPHIGLFALPDVIQEANDNRLDA